MKLRIALGALGLLAALPLLAQPRSSRTPRFFRSELVLQGYVFGNFFQAPEGKPTETVNAYSVEYRTAVRPWKSPTDLYAQVDYINYASLGGEGTTSGRVGIAHEGRVHSVNAFVDHAENRASFDVDDTTTRADITLLSGDYSYRISPNWQVGAEGERQMQRYGGNNNINESDYEALGAWIRYRGWGSLASPSFGYVTGRREAVDDRSDYDDAYWWVRVASTPHPRVYATLRYRDRHREYRSIERADDRGQWAATVSFRQSDRLSWNAYYARESVDSSLPNRDFTRNVLLVGVGWAF